MIYNFKKPAPIAVYVTVQPRKDNGLSKAFTSRIGVCNAESEIAALIADDLAAMNDTFGGLIEAVSVKGRSYRAFRAEWTELKI